MPLSLPQLLRKCRESLDCLPRAIDSPAATRARNVLDRDLLPRTLGDSPYLVVGIIGPANSGKSALFNYLAQSEVSPSRSEGGLTKSLLGIANTNLFQVLDQSPELRRFPLQKVDSGDEALEFPNSPDELLLKCHEAMPNGLLLIDTPDFDSVVGENRLAAESLLSVSDLVILVVTRHTYQNREVVHFLQRWLDSGRPWILLYNEAQDLEQDLENVRKLVRDIGAEPLACFSMPHKYPPFQLPPSTLYLHEESHDYFDLLNKFSSTEGQQELKSNALHAAVNLVCEDIEEIAAELAARCGTVRELQSEAKKLLQACARACALSAIPLAQLLKSIRSKQTATPFFKRILFSAQRWWLKAVFSIRPKLLPAKCSVVESIEYELKKSWNLTANDLKSSLGRNDPSSVRQECDVHLAELLDSDLKAHSKPEFQSHLANELSKVVMEFETKLCDIDLPTHLYDKINWALTRSCNLTLSNHHGQNLVSSEPELEDPFTVRLVNQLIQNDAFMSAVNRWTTKQSETLSYKFLEVVFGASSCEWERICKQEGDCLGELRGLSSEIGASLAIWSENAKINPEIPISNSNG